MSSATLKIVLLSPRGLVRELLREVLRLRCDARIVASASAFEDCDAALAQADVLIIDTHEMPARAMDDFNSRRKLELPRLRVFLIKESLEKGGIDDLLLAVRGASLIGPESLAQLTPLETEVLAAVASGMRNSEIARRMRRSPKTVEKHRASLLRKLGLRSVAQLTAYSLRHGLVNAEVILATRRS
jgi:DNA-binding NarL/FixJ family response regulator